MGFYGRASEVWCGLVSQALLAIRKTISMALGKNSTKEGHTNKLTPRLQQIMDAFQKADPPTVKKLPVEVDVPKTLAKKALAKGATELEATVGDWAVIAWYFLLRVGEYITKRLRQHTKQTKQFKMQDVRFFKKDEKEKLRMLPRWAPEGGNMAADSATLKLDNQKNGWKNVCTNHWKNGYPAFDCVRALGQ